MIKKLILSLALILPILYTGNAQANEVDNNIIMTDSPNLEIKLNTDSNIKLELDDVFIMTCVNTDTKEEFNIPICFGEVDKTTVEIPSTSVYKINNITYKGMNKTLLDAPMCISEYIETDWYDTTTIKLYIGEELYDAMMPECNMYRKKSFRNDSLEDSTSKDTTIVTNAPPVSVDALEIQVPDEEYSNTDNEEDNNKKEKKQKKSSLSQAGNDLLINLCLGSVLAIIGLIVIYLLKRAGKIK